MSKETFSVDKDIFSVGTHNGSHYGPEVLDAMVQNFETLKTKDPSFRVPLKIDVFKFADGQRFHGGIPAFGYASALKRVGDKIVATITDIPRKLKDIIDNKGYRQVSIELMEKFTHPMVGPLNNTLKAIALLGVDNPGCKSLDEVWSFYGAVAGQEDLATEFVVEDNTKQEAHMTDQEALDLKAKLAKAEQDAKDFQAKVTGLEGELKVTKEAATAAETRASQLADGQRKAGIAQFVEARKAEGKLLPAHEQAVIAVFESIDDAKTVEFALADGKKEQKTVRSMFEEMLASMPKLVEFKEKTGEAKPEDTKFQAQDEAIHGPAERQELHFKAGEYLKAHPEVTYRDALIEVSKKPVA
jgi:hypothetical protein